MTVCIEIKIHSLPPVIDLCKFTSKRSAGGISPFRFVDLSISRAYIFLFLSLTYSCLQRGKYTPVRSTVSITYSVIPFCLARYIADLVSFLDI